jgi:eukaryotic-like serine/threonine-protein kinase
MLSSEGRVKVGDFGVARLAEGSTDGTAASIVGTPRYMAPEQGRGRPTTPATDVYSAGVVLYEMLSGAPPFTAASVVELALCHLQEAPPPLSVRLPTSLVQIVDRALAKDPAHRYADGAEMAEALLEAGRRSADRRAAHPLPVRARVAARPPRAPRRDLVGAAAGPRRSPARPSTPAEPPSTPMGPPNLRIRTPAPPPAPPGPHGTRRAAQFSRRRNVNPSRRRRAAAALGLVIALLVAMVTAAVVIGHTTYTRVPSVRHLRKARALTVLRRAHLRVTMGTRHAMAAAGTVIGQTPSARTRVSQGTMVHLTISRGPAPVPVVTVIHEQVADAEQALHSLGLRTTVREVAAPGTTPGIVMGQSPAGGHSAPRGSTVALSVAEVPSWHTVTTFTGRDSGTFHITGRHWRVAYTMGFHGTCTWILFCSGPSARVLQAGTGRYVAGFGLQNGTGQIQSLRTGAGSYDIRVTPGGDSAGWSLQVQDLY